MMRCPLLLTSAVNGNKASLDAKTTYLHLKIEDTLNIPAPSSDVNLELEEVV
jgi:hypothetical protein